MPFSINGTFTIINTFTPNTPILSADVNADFDDIASGMTELWARTQAWTINKRVFTASDTYIPTDGLLGAISECGGGGGGGGYANGVLGSARSSGGGGAGEYSRKWLSPGDIGSSKVITIGDGGAGGTGAHNDGVAGGYTSLGAICIARGGQGGVSIVTTGHGGLGGTGGTGDFLCSGAPGMPGVAYSGIGNPPSVFAPVLGGMGGNGPWGGGGLGVYALPGGDPGGDAVGYCSGGAGASVYNFLVNRDGGAGFKGVCIITEFIGPT